MIRNEIRKEFRNESRSEAARDNRGASLRQKRGLGGALGHYLRSHRQGFTFAFGQLLSHPFSTLMTVAVLGIALALPAGLHVVLTNARAVTSGWDGATQFSLFLKANISAAKAASLAQELRGRRDIAKVRLVSPDEALAEFRRLSGFGAALDALDRNPLPAVLIVTPARQGAGPEQVTTMAKRLGARSEVDFAQLDSAWIRRLYALMAMANRGVWVLAAMLSLAVLLVVGNTIRLAIYNRRDEIVISKLIGASDAFIRRPFLYTGLWYGLAGGLLAIAIVSLSLWTLHGPTTHLAVLYHTDFALRGLGAAGAAGTVGVGTVLGLLGSWLAVGRHLRDIEPT